MKYAQGMKSIKKSSLTILVVFLSVIIVFAIAEGYYYLFLFPILALCLFLFYYLHRQEVTDGESQAQKAVTFAQKDKEAEQWIQKSLAPSTLSLILKRRHFVE